VGLAIGSIRIKGVSLGIAGVLFSGLIVGHFYGPGYWTPPTAGHFEGGLDEHVLHFAQEFGLILFVYTIGVQVGPGFFASLRKQGLPLNIMAASIVLLSVLVTVGIRYVGQVETPAAVGLFSGATTNTPSLAASQAALRDQLSKQKHPETGQPLYTADQIREKVNVPVLGYAVAYPFGIMGIIMAMLLIRGIGRIDPHKEAEAFAALGARKEKALSVMNIEVKNPNLHGKRIIDIPALPELGVVISRVARNGDAKVARRETVLEQGNVLLAVGPKERLNQLRDVVGDESTIDIRTLPSKIITRRVVVTQNQVLGKTVAELDLSQRFGVMMTRLARVDVEIPPTRTKLQFGDTCVLVGEEESVKEAAAFLGDQVKKLSHPQIIPIFVGIVLGVIVGSWPINIGLPAPVKLGLAGGPLVVAIILSRLGHIGPLVWHLPASANLAIREIGIVLFLACVGLRSGDQFLDTLRNGDGFYWMAVATLITILPLLVVGFIGRFVYKVNFLTLCGVLAGSMTDPPALAFANTVSQSDAPSVSYATVYPLTMLLRVLSAQALVLLMT
jgi:putative transport protein